MKTLKDAKFSKEVFTFSVTNADQYVKIGSFKAGYYVCYNLTKQQISNEQSNTIIYPVYDVKGLKVY
jgi:hypothetical protein